MKTYAEKFDMAVSHARNLSVVSHRVHTELRKMVGEPSRVQKERFEELFDYLDDINARVTLTKNMLKRLMP